MDKPWNDDPLYMGQIESQAAQIKALQAFKDYVHKRLDDAGIPTHPEGNHSKAGCRVGDRLDIALIDKPLVLRGGLLKIKRLATMSAELMRDQKRTGRWEGSERTARAFERLANDAEVALSK